MVEGPKRRVEPIKQQAKDIALNVRDWFKEKVSGKARKALLIPEHSSRGLCSGRQDSAARVAKIFSASYEQDFLEVSYGFREGLSGYEAHKAFELSIMRSGVN